MARTVKTWAEFVNSLGPKNRRLLLTPNGRVKLKGVWKRNNRLAAGEPKKPTKPLPRPTLNPNAYLSDPEYLSESGFLEEQYRRQTGLNPDGTPAFGADKKPLIGDIQYDYQSGMADLQRQEIGAAETHRKAVEDLRANAAARGVYRSGIRVKNRGMAEADRVRVADAIRRGRSDLARNRASALEGANLGFTRQRDALRTGTQRRIADTFQDRQLAFDDGSPLPTPPKPVRERKPIPSSFSEFRKKAGKGWTPVQLRNAWRRINAEGRVGT